MEPVGRGAYRHSCPVCGGPNTEYRLANGLPCPRCLPPREAARLLEKGRPGILEVARVLETLGRLRGDLEELSSLEEESWSLIRFFEEAVGSPPWGAQRTWARRLVRGDSFSIIAPTGVGKTTFGVVAGLFVARRGGRAVIVVPTTTLVVQTARRARALAERVGVDPERIVEIHSKMGRKARLEAQERAFRGDYGLLIITAAFARKHAGELGKRRHRLVFVDDVDAALRSAKSVDAVLKLVGFTDRDIELGLEALRLQRMQARLVARIAELQALRGQRAREIERLRRELQGVERELSRLMERLERARRRVASLIVSSATGRPRGSRVRLFRVLLGFEAGGRGDIGLRRVVDSYTMPGDGVYEKAVELVARLRDGVLVYVPLDHGVEGAERLAEMLREAGLEAEAFHARKPASLLDDFAEGRLNVLVGVANYYGVLVRGIDLPARVKYAVFAGVPRHRFTAEIGEPHPSRLLRLLGLLVDAPIREVAEEARRHVAQLRRIVRSLSPAALQLVAEKVLEGDVSERPARIVWEAYNFLRNALQDEEVWEYLSSRSDVAVVEEEGRRYILVADAATYVQASGRTSRLYAGGITKGLSIVVVDDERVFRGLVRRTQWMVDARWVPLEELDLDSLIREIEEERRRVRELLGGRVRVPDLVKTALLVVESPNKARTIARFFGQPSIRILPGGLRAYEVATGDYILTVAASGGHVYDLVVEAEREDLPGAEEAWVDEVFGVSLLDSGGRDYVPVYTSIKRCLDCGYQFTEERDTCPICGSTRIRDSRVVVSDLRRLAWEVDVVLVGTDPDTEGEKIGWDLALLLGPYSRRLMRLEFHEVTRKAIQEALRAMRSFDQRLVDAQIVRRVEDRWIGFTLSPLLWCHFWPSYYCARRVNPRSSDYEKCRRARYFYNLSAGRVQTPTLGWIVERTRENRERVPAFRLQLPLDGERVQIYFRADQLDEPLDPEEARYRAFQRLGLPRARRQGEGEPVEVEVEVEVLEDEWTRVPPPPPYTTDAMIADANRYLRLGAPETMRLAQNLFEWGLITYHRTDSTRVSEKGIEVAAEWIRERFPDLAGEIFRPRRWGEGGAHEAIRPTRPIDAETLERLIEEGILEVAGVMTRAHLRLYDLIFRRFIASQMREAEVRRVKYRVRVPELGSITLERIVEVGRPGDEASKGFALVWPYLRPQPPLPTGRVYGLLSHAGDVGKVPLYTQGDVIRLMKEKGIGRPSTYAKIVETLFRRKYVVRVGGDGDRVKATSRGEAVYDYLTVYLREAPEEELPSVFRVEALRRVPMLVSEERTRQLQEKMDMIEKGDASRREVLDEIYREIEDIALPVTRAFRRPTGSLGECVSGYRRRGEAGEGG